MQRPFETLVEQDVVAIGDPDEVLRVARRYEAAGFFLAIANFGGLPHKRVLRSMELMARHVLPRRALARPGDPAMATRVETPYTQRALLLLARRLQHPEAGHPRPRLRGRARPRLRPASAR